MKTTDTEKGMIDLGIAERDYPCCAEPAKDKPKTIHYPEFTIKDKPELFDTPEEEFLAVVKLKRSSREERADWDNPDKMRTYVGFKVLGIKQLKEKPKTKEVSAADFKVDFSPLETEEDDKD